MTASAPPGPAKARNAPPAASPTTCALAEATLSIERPSTNASPGSTSGNIAARAAKNTGENTPVTSTSASIAQTGSPA